MTFEIGGILSFDVGVHRVFDTQTVELRFGQATPDCRFVDFGSELQSPVNRDDVFDEDVNSVDVEVVFLVDDQSFLVQAVVRSNLGDLRDVVVLQLVDVPDNLALVGANGSEQEQVLQVLVLAERWWLNDDLLEDLDELHGKIRVQERLDGN